MMRGGAGRRLSPGAALAAVLLVGCVGGERGSGTKDGASVEGCWKREGEAIPVYGAGEVGYCFGPGGKVTFWVFEPPEGYESRAFYEVWAGGFALWDDFPDGRTRKDAMYCLFSKTERELTISGCDLAGVWKNECNDVVVTKDGDVTCRKNSASAT